MESEAQVPGTVGSQTEASCTTQITHVTPQAWQYTIWSIPGQHRLKTSHWKSRDTTNIIEMMHVVRTVTLGKAQLRSGVKWCFLRQRWEVTEHRSGAVGREWWECKCTAQCVAGNNWVGGAGRIRGATLSLSLKNSLSLSLKHVERAPVKSSQWAHMDEELPSELNAGVVN